MNHFNIEDSNDSLNEKLADVPSKAKKYKFLSWICSRSCLGHLAVDCETFPICHFIDKRNTSLFSRQHKTTTFFSLLDSDMASRSESLGCGRNTEPRPVSPTDTGTHCKAFFYPGVPGCGDKMVMPHVWSMLGPVSIPAPCGQGPPSQLITSQT